MMIDMVLQVRLRLFSSMFTQSPSHDAIFDDSIRSIFETSIRFLDMRNEEMICDPWPVDIQSLQDFPRQCVLDFFIGIKRPLLHESRWVVHILGVQVANDLVGVIFRLIVRQLRHGHERVLRKLITTRLLQNI